MAANALDALEAASLAGEFYYHVTQASFGQYVDQIGRYPGAGSTGWVFKVNNASPPVGADKVMLKDGDTRALVLRGLRVGLRAEDALARLRRATATGSPPTTTRARSRPRPARCSTWTAAP